MRSVTQQLDLGEQLLSSLVNKEPNQRTPTNSGLPPSKETAAENARLRKQVAGLVPNGHFEAMWWQTGQTGVSTVKQHPPHRQELLEPYELSVGFGLIFGLPKLMGPDGPDPWEVDTEDLIRKQILV